jgi:hypothetical protein
MALAVTSALGGAAAFITMVALVLRAIFKQVSATEGNTKATDRLTDAVGEMSEKVGALDTKVTVLDTRVTALEDRRRRA